MVGSPRIPNPGGTLNFLKGQAKAFPYIAQIAPNLVHFDACNIFVSFTLIRIVYTITMDLEKNP